MERLGTFFNVCSTPRWIGLQRYPSWWKHGIYKVWMGSVALFFTTGEKRRALCCMGARIGRVLRRV